MHRMENGRNGRQFVSVFSLIQRREEFIGNDCRWLLFNAAA